MSVKTDVVNLVITVNGNDAKKKFYDLQATAAGLRSEMNGLKKGTEEWIAKSKELKEVEKNISEVRKEVKLTDLSIKELGKEIGRLRGQRNNLDPLSDAFKQLDGQVKQAEKRMKELQTGTGFLAKSFNFLKSEAVSFGVVALGALGIDFLIGKFKGLIQSQAELSDSFAQIRRTTGLTQQGVEDLNKSLSKIDTRTAKKDLREIAVVLGQVGEAANAESIAAIDKIVVALGDEFQGGADEITSALSILRNNFTAFKSDNYAGDIEKIGNALSVLGKSGLATAPIVTDMATRMSGVLGTFKVTAGQTLGLSAAMQEMGITVERGSTAVTKLVQKMAQNPEVFAKVAGAKTRKEIDEFVKLLNEDAVSALLKVAEGSKAAGNSNVEFAAILKELESTGAGVSEVLAKFAANGTMVKEKVDLASESIQKTDTIQNSFAISNENLAAKVAKLGKEFAKLWESEAVTNFLKKSVDSAFNFIQALKYLGHWIQDNWYWMKALTAAYIAYYIASGKLIAIETYRLAINKASAAATAIQTAATVAYNLVLGVLTLNIGRVASSWKLLTAAMSVNPFVAIATIIVGATVALDGWLKKQQEFERELALSKIDIAFKKRMKSITDDVEDNLKYLRQNLDKFSKEELEANIVSANKMTEFTADKVKKQADLYKDLERQRSEQQKKLASLDNAFTLEKTYQKESLELEKLTKKRDNAKEALDLLVTSTEKYADITVDMSVKLKDANDKQIASAKELSAAEKKAQEERKKALEAYAKELADYNKKVEQAKIDLIEEDKARDLASLDFKHKLDVQEIEAQAQKLAAEAKALGKSVAEQNKIISDAAFIKLQSEEEYQRNRIAIIEKYAEALKKGNYDNEIKALNDNLAVQKLMYDRLYADGVISKNEHDLQITNADRRSKQELIDIAKRYGIDTTKVEQDIANDDIKVLEDKIERKKRLLQREADFRVALAQYNLDNNPNSGAAAEELMRAQLAQLQTQMEIEIGLHEGHEEEILQIKREYNLKKQQLDDEFNQQNFEKNINIASQYIELFNNAANQVFSFRQGQLQNELAEQQQKLQKEDQSNEQSYKNRILSDVEYQNRKKANREKTEKLEREARRKQAILDKAQALFNIGLATAQSLIQLWVNPGFPAAIPMAVSVGALGALEAAFVAAKPIPQAYTGGYRGKQKVRGAQDGRTYDAEFLPGFGGGYVSNPSLLVGERGREYVVNSTALENSSIRRIVDGIDAFTQGKINTVDFQSMLAMPAMQQRYTGGYVGTNSTTTTAPVKTSVNSGNELMIVLANTLSRLNQHLDNGIQAEARIGDKTIVDFEERKTYLNKIIDNAN